MAAVARFVGAVADVLHEAPVWSRYIRGAHRAEAVLLVEHVLGVAVDAPEAPSAEVGRTHVDEVNRLLHRRIRDKVPVPYLVGRTIYDRRRLDIGERLFIPRNALEYVLDEVVASVPWRDEPRMLDLCCGIGAVGVAVASRVPGLRVDHADVDGRAVAAACRNSELHGLADRVEGHTGDLFAALPAGRRYDLVTVNPPYVPEHHEARTCREVRHEPRVALFSDGDGLSLTRAILAAAPRWLAPRGVLVLKCSPSQHEQLAWILDGRGRWWHRGGTPLHLVSVTRDELVG